MNILVIDDNAQVRKMLSSYLAKNGHTVDIANDGKQGLDLIEQPHNSYDLIFTDIKMPVMNGLELLEKIRTKELDVPVIIMTGYAVIELTLKAFKLGAYDFLTKPFEFKPLLATLDKIESLKADKQEMINVSKFYRSKIQFSIPSQTKYIKSLVPTIQSHYKYLCELYRQDIHGIASCLFETIKNAIVYGNLGLEPAMKKDLPEEFNDMIIQREADSHYSEKKVTVRAEFDQHKLVFEIEDEGMGFDRGTLPDFSVPITVMPENRGLFIVHSNMDEVSWNDNGNCIRMVKYLQR